MNPKDRFRALKILPLVLALAGCQSLPWTPKSRYHCPHIIPEEQYEKLETISTIRVVPMDEFNRKCPEGSMACVDPWVNKETRELAFADIWLPERLPVEMRASSIFHEICHLDEIDRGIDPVISGQHVGWIEPEGLYRPESVRVMAALP